MERALAREYGWTPKQVGALDPDFIEEQLAIWQAQADYQSRPKPPTAKGRKK